MGGVDCIYGNWFRWLPSSSFMSSSYGLPLPILLPHYSRGGGLLCQRVRSVFSSCGTAGVWCSGLLVASRRRRRRMGRTCFFAPTRSGNAPVVEKPSQPVGVGGGGHRPCCYPRLVVDVGAGVSVFVVCLLGGWACRAVVLV